MASSKIMADRVVFRCPGTTLSNLLSVGASSVFDGIPVGRGQAVDGLKPLPPPPTRKSSGTSPEFTVLDATVKFPTRSNS